MAVVLPLSVKVAMGLLFVGAIFFLTGFSTAYWTEFDYPFTYTNKLNSEYHGVTREHFGLWRRCFYMLWASDDPLVDRRHNYDAGCFSWFSNEGRLYRDIDGELRAVQFCTTLALLFTVTSFVMLVVGATQEACQSKKLIPVLAGVAALLAALCTGIGVIVFHTWEGSRDGLDWSFALTVVGGVIFAIAGVVINAGVLLGK